ncbi:hypothetical protein Tco_1029244 [Tanacetum coccineum]|uniref:Uncharacterized protein n=1 Tax=Tanacetum coccineum TaxID=301880 RepID=A0ABQ5G2W0_9ASTR
MAVRRIADIERDVPERCNMLSGHVVEIKMMNVALREERMKRYSARIIPFPIHVIQNPPITKGTSDVALCFGELDLTVKGFVELDYAGDIDGNKSTTRYVFTLCGRTEPDSPEAAPASPDYVPGPEEPEQAPLSPDNVPGPEYPEYLAPSDEEVPVEDQPYAVADSPIALSPGYVADSDPEEDPEEDFEDGPVDYPVDRGNGDDDDSSDDDDEEEEASKEEEDEHLAPVDFVVAPVVDHVPSSGETEPFETDESAATPP